jgi:hypothetical protein
LIILGGLFYPQINEDTSSSCAALERKVVRLLTQNKEGSAFTSLIFKGILKGAFAQELIKSRYPNLPPIVGCSIFYYEVMLNPDAIQKL